MSDETTPIARLRLARAPLRLLAAPLVFAAAGAAAIVAGAAPVGGIAGAALVAAGSLAIALATYLGAFVFSISVEIEPGTVHLRWLGGGRRYALVRGAVARVTLRGAGRASLRTRFGAMGWALGSAELRGEERIDVVRLAPTPSMILIPTDFGRLGIAAASETELLEALGSAARMQQRLEETIAVRAPARVADRAAADQGRVLTGIERSLLEERLAAERAAAEAAAEAERRAAEATAIHAASAPRPDDAVDAAGTRGGPPASTATLVTPVAADGARPRPRTAWKRPAWLRLPLPSRGRGPANAMATSAGAGKGVAASGAAAAMVATPRVVAPSVAAPSVAVTRPWRSRFPATGAILVIGAPLAAAAVTWVASLVAGVTLPPADGRLLTLALALAGPLGALATVAARAWYPRLQPLVSATAVIAVALVARVVVG